MPLLAQLVDGSTGEVYEYPTGVDACAAARRESGIDGGTWAAIVVDLPECREVARVYRRGEYDGKVIL